MNRIVESGRFANCQRFHLGCSRPECRGIPILDHLQVLAIKHRFPRHFEHFVRDSHHAHVRILGPSFRMGADGVNPVTQQKTGSLNRSLSYP